MEKGVLWSQCSGRNLHFRSVTESQFNEDPRLLWPALAFEAPALKVQCVAGKWQLHCLVRRKWVALEPEEWVRQHVAAALAQTGWPLGRMVLEHPVRFGQVSGRVDMACFDRDGKVSLAVEVKAPHVPLDAKVADQVARYDLALTSPMLMITNGLRTAVWSRGEDGVLIPSPSWPKPPSD